MTVTMTPTKGRPAIPSTSLAAARAVKAQTLKQTKTPSRVRQGIGQGNPASGTLLFDISPIRAFEGIELRARGVVFRGNVTEDAWRSALSFAASAQEAGPYWVGELLAYAETRQGWSDMIDAAMSSLGMARHTLINQTYIARNVGVEARLLSPSISHSAEVAAMPPAEQKVWLSKARDGEMTRNELRREIRADKRRRTIEGQATLEGQYRVIYADPPWSYGSGTKGGSRVQDSFPPMSMEDIMKLPIEAHSTPDAVLFMWVTAPMLYENPGPRDIIEAWGFKPKTGIVWDKVRGVGGSYAYIRHEHLIIATRGSCLPDVTEPMIQSVHVERRPNDFEHSEKPATFRKAIERVYTKGPYLELFGREPVPGWTVFGNDARLWHEQVT
ncbi:MAG: MT-A70 family methyltransferase [Thermoplasmatota archaeon]